jgi:putative Mg2+ transporter-C (MgtC) family protein
MDMSFFDPAVLSASLNVLVALLLGMLLGAERTLAHKTAGLRTYGLVAMGSALFIVVARVAGQSDILVSDSDIMRVTAGVITGIGFLCAGTIILRDVTVVGLTTAAGLWIAAGIGIAAGFGLHTLAVLATFLTLATFTIFWFVEREVTEIGEKNDGR